MYKEYDSGEVEDWLLQCSAWDHFRPLLAAMDAEGKISRERMTRTKQL